jgi:nitroreductase
MGQGMDTVPLRNAIFGRRSVRAYSPEPVDALTLRALLAAAVRAPTAMHGEPWQFVIVHNPELLKRLSARAIEGLAAEAVHLGAGRDILSQPGFNVFYDARSLIVICAKSDGKFANADCWLAAQNLMLTAYAMGLGSCVIGMAVPMLNLPEVKLELGIPPGSTAVAPIIVGKPRGETWPAARHEPQIVAWR